MRLRWLVVIIPCLAIGILDLWTDHEWSEVLTNPENTLIVPALALFGGIVIAGISFRRIDRLAATVRERDASLARQIAVAAERERIAREMHDGLAQVLGYVNTKAQAVEELLAAGQTNEARKNAVELAAAVRSVYVDVREAILGLASPVDEDRGLVPALEEYSARFAEAAKIAVSVDAANAARTVRLSPTSQAEVFRIAQEALTNIRKHARAHRVQLAVDLADRDLVLTVVDDGVGLASEQDPPAGWPHYGMRAMRERAAAVGGTAEWRSVPGSGTTFRLRVPVGGTAAAS